MKNLKHINSFNEAIIKWYDKGNFSDEFIDEQEDSLKIVKDYTFEIFKEDYYHDALNNNLLVRNILRTNIWRSIKISAEIATEKLGLCNFEIDRDKYWIFDFKGDRFYFDNNEYEGSSIGILCKKKDKTKNWIFDPEEYKYQNDKNIYIKLLTFLKALSIKLM